MILVKHKNQGNLKAYFYFALEEYIMKNLLEEGKSFFFTWKIKGVVVGKHQVLENEVNIDYLKENNIELFRRPTGGGAIYADENNTMFSFIVNKDKKMNFRPYLQLVIDAMKKLNLEITFSGRNDLLYEDKKISGVAYLQNKYGFLIHGTYMYDVDIETMIRAITPNDEKLISKGIDSVRNRVANLKEALNGLTLSELIEHLENEITTSVYELSDEEEKIIFEMAKKYEKRSWRFDKQPPHTKVLKKRIKGGMFNIMLDLRYGIIENIKISGDFFNIQPVSLIENKLKNTSYNEKAIREKLKEIKLESIIVDLEKEEFMELLLSGIINAS